MRIEYHPAIEGELAEIRDYYNKQSHNLGDDLSTNLRGKFWALLPCPLAGW